MLFWKRLSPTTDPDQGVSDDKFDRANHLIGSGKKSFWRFVDQQIKKFDRQEFTLRPNKVITAAIQLEHERKNISRTSLQF